MEKNLDDMNWEELPLPEAPDKELKHLRKSLRKRNAAIILTSLVLAAALLLAAVYVVIPGLETLYWNPNTISFGTEDVTDLDLTLSAYAELFCPDINILHTHAAKTGFAAYSIDVEIWDEGIAQYSQLTLDKGTLSFPRNFWKTASYGAFAPFPEPYAQMNRDGQTQTLSELPEYITVSAAITFTDDMGMDSLLKFQHLVQTLEGNVGWVAIRHKDELTLDDTICGINLSLVHPVQHQVNDFYPCFDINSIPNTAANLVDHFKSLLHYSQDQYLLGTGIEPSTEGYYDSVLNYVEEKGVLTFGCYVEASPAALLQLQDWHTVSHIQIMGARIDVK